MKFSAQIYIHHSWPHRAFYITALQHCHYLPATPCSKANQNPITIQQKGKKMLWMFFCSEFNYSYKCELVLLAWYHP